MYLNNFWHNLSTVLTQTLEGFNDLCIKAHDLEIHLNKWKKIFKGSGWKPSRLLSTAVTPRDKAPYNIGPSLAKNTQQNSKQ